MSNETMRTPADVRERVVTGRLASLLDADADWLHDGAMAGRLPDRCQTVAERIRALLRTPAAPGWSEVRERANMLRAVLREHGFEHLRSALVGQHSDAVFYGQWERHKALLRDLLDALDAALRSEAQGKGGE